MALNVIMMGPPGAGKGTQAGRFARERALLKISTGDILREAIKEKNPIALEAKAKMDRGELVDDDNDDCDRRRASDETGCGARVRARRVPADGRAGAGTRRDHGTSAAADRSWSSM